MACRGRDWSISEGRDLVGVGAGKGLRAGPRKAENAMLGKPPRFRRRRDDVV